MTIRSAQAHSIVLGGKYIRPVRRRSYLWLRGLSWGTVAVLTAKFRTGFDWSFLIFVVSFYALVNFDSSYLLTIGAGFEITKHDDRKSDGDVA